MNVTVIIIPVFVCGIILYGICKKIDVFGAFVSGAKESIIVGFDILPSLVALMLGVEMFKASGALSAIVSLLSPLTSFIGLPGECIPLALMRPISGSGAMSLLTSIFETNSPDSFVGRVASVLLGSTETTFYTIAVYFGATRIKKTRHALPSALAGDFTAMFLSGLAVRLIMH